MTIFRTAYETTACQGYVTKKIEEGLQKAQIVGTLYHLAPLLREVRGADALELALPGFAHPFLVKGTKGYDDFIAIDARPYGKIDARQGVWVTAQSTLMEYLEARGALNLYWVTKSPEALRDIAPAGMACYAEFVGKSLARRFALDRREEHDLSVIVAWFYLCLFNNDEKFDDRQVARMVQSITRAMRSEAQMVYEIVDRFEQAPIQNLTHLVEMLVKHVHSVRLESLNAGIVTQILGGGWYGTANAREEMAVAIEHPPTWLTILHQAATNRTFSKSGVSNTFEKLPSAMQSQFLQAFAAFIRSYKDELSPVAPNMY